MATLGYRNNETSAVIQRVTIPANATTLVYWRLILSDELCGDYDVGGVTFDTGGAKSNVLDAYNLCRSTSSTAWVQRVIDVRPFAGQTGDLYILAGNDASNVSFLDVDDVSIQTTSTSMLSVVSVDEQAALRLTQLVSTLSR